MTGTVLQVVNAGSFWLLVVNLRKRIAEQVIEPRYMQDLVEGEGLADPSDLVGREVELAGDGMSISLVRVDGWPQAILSPPHHGR